MNAEHLEDNIKRVNKIMTLIKELDLTEERKEVIESFYPNFSLPKKKETVFLNLKDDIVASLKKRTTYRDQRTIIEKLFKFQMAYVDAK